MSYFDEIKNKISQTSQTAIQKTKTFSEEQKLNQEINELLRQNELLFAQIGKLYFEKYSDDNQDEELGKLLEEVNDNNSRLEEKQQRRRNLKGLVVCTNCGMEVSSEASFCPGCGTKIEKPEIEYVEEETEQRLCTNCGNVLDEDARFCVHCGQPVEQS